MRTENYNKYYIQGSDHYLISKDEFVDLNEMVENFEKENQKLKSQQKEFMTFLEDNWKETQDIWYIKILNKYKEIIGE